MKPIEFGDYMLFKKLAAGGMGEVFLARQERGAGFERYVAIKRILPELSDDDEFVRMFLDEARLAARLNHPNVVQIYDLGICGDQYFLAMEFLEGRDLRRIMGRLATYNRALPGAHAIQIIYGAAEGLFYAHNLKDDYGNPLHIIHRDVSPQNIFVTFHGTVKVLDFGIAKAEARSVRTRTGGLKGKYPYLSPEQVRGDEVDHRSDIFSLGTVLWEVTVGRRLFKRENDLLTLQAVLHCEVPPPSDLMNKYPPELERIVMRALATNPDDRYASCRAFQEDLEAFMGQYGLVLSPQKLGDSVRRTFADEPGTVQEVLDQLKQKPRSLSLLHDDESSDSHSRSEPVAVVEREPTDPSGPSQQILLDLARAAEEDSDPSRSEVSRPFAPPERPPEMPVPDFPAKREPPAEPSDDRVLPAAQPAAADWDMARADISLEFSRPGSLDEADLRIESPKQSPEPRTEPEPAEAPPPTEAESAAALREAYQPPSPSQIGRPDTAADAEPPRPAIAQDEARPKRSPIERRDTLKGPLSFPGLPVDTIDDSAGLVSPPELQGGGSPEQLDAAPKQEPAPPAEGQASISSEPEGVQEVITAAKALGDAWTVEGSQGSNTESMLHVISSVPTVIRNVKDLATHDAQDSKIRVADLTGDPPDEVAATLVSEVDPSMVPPTSPSPIGPPAPRADEPGSAPLPMQEEIESDLPAVGRESASSSVPPSGLDALWSRFRRRPVLIPVVLILAFVLPFGATILVMGLDRDGGEDGDEGPRRGAIGQVSGESDSPPSDLPEAGADSAHSQASDGGAADEATGEGDAGSAAGGDATHGEEPAASPEKGHKAPPPRLRPKVSVSISTVPENLLVWVDGRRLGTSPVRASLPPGSYRVKLRNSNLGIDYGTRIRVDEDTGSRQQIRVPEGTLSLRIRPYADVYINGRRRGLTPMPPVELYAGRHRVRLVNDSLERSIVRTVTVRPNQRTVLDVNMAAAP